MCETIPGNARGKLSDSVAETQSMGVRHASISLLGTPLGRRLSAQQGGPAAGVSRVMYPLAKSPAIRQQLLSIEARQLW